jgi:hypothetical protein
MRAVTALCAVRSGGVGLFEPYLHGLALFALGALTRATLERAG